MSSSSSTPESADRPHASTSFWRDVAHALKGEQHDYTKAIFLGIVGAAFVILAYPLAGLFASDPETLTYAARALWIVSLALPLYAAGMCFEGAFNGAGDTWTPTRLNFFCFWLGQVPLAWALANIAGLGALGVFISVPVSFSVLALWSAVLFKRGKWKLQKV